MSLIYVPGSKLLGTLLLAFSPLHGQSKPEWRPATVVYATHAFSHNTNVTGPGASGVIQSAHEQFDLATEGMTYTVEQWVTPPQLLRLPEGAPVSFALNGKHVFLKTPDGNIRKMKLVASYVKQSNPKSPTPH